jgi:RNA polymerase sigma-70 factor (ECF subfamily)
MSQAEPTRASLLVRIRDPRDRSAWGEFVEIYAPLVYAMARRLGLQDADAADLAQDVLRSVSRSIGRLDYDPRKGSFRSWLFTVTRNALNSYFEAQKRSPRGSGDSSVQAWLEARPDPATESAAWDREFQQRLLAHAADQVRPSVQQTTWEAFWQTAVEGMPVQDVAARLGMSVGAVYIARSRVLGRIKDQVRQYLDE